MERGLRLRFFAARLALALVALASPALVIVSLHGGSAGPERCYGLPGFSHSSLTMTAFLNAAVERRGPDAAYPLVTRALRRGMGCARWSAHPPVAAFRGIDWRLSVIKTVSESERVIVLDLHLVSASGQEGHFRMSLVRVKSWLDPVFGIWKVDQWRRASGSTPSS